MPRGKKVLIKISYPRSVVELGCEKMDLILEDKRERMLKEVRTKETKVVRLQGKDRNWT